MLERHERRSGLSCITLEREAVAAGKRSLKKDRFRRPAWRHFVHLVVEPERADQLELPADGERDRHRLVPGGKDAVHHPPLAAGRPVRRPCASAAVTAPAAVFEQIG